MRYQVCFLSGRPLEFSAALRLVNNTTGDICDGWASEQSVFDVPGRPDIPNCCIVDNTDDTQVEFWFRSMAMPVAGHNYTILLEYDIEPVFSELFTVFGIVEDYPISCDFNAPYVVNMDPRMCTLSAFAVLQLQVANFVPECRYIIGNYRLPVITEDAFTGAVVCQIPPVPPSLLSSYTVGIVPKSDGQEHISFGVSHVTFGFELTVSKIFFMVGNKIKLNEQEMLIGMLSKKKPAFSYLIEAIDFDDLMSLDLTSVDMQDMFLEVLRLAIDNYKLNLEDIDEQELTIAQYSCLLGWNTVLRALVVEFNLNLDGMQAALSDYSVLGGFEDNIAYLLQYRNRHLVPLPIYQKPEPVQEPEPNPLIDDLIRQQQEQEYLLQQEQLKALQLPVLEPSPEKPKPEEKKLSGWGAVVQKNMAGRQKSGVYTTAQIKDAQRDDEVKEPAQPQAEQPPTQPESDSTSLASPKPSILLPDAPEDKKVGWGDVIQKNLRNRKVSNAPLPAHRISDDKAPTSDSAPSTPSTSSQSISLSVSASIPNMTSTSVEESHLPDPTSLKTSTSSLDPSLLQAHSAEQLEIRAIEQSKQQPTSDPIPEPNANPSPTESPEKKTPEKPALSGWNSMIQRNMNNRPTSGRHNAEIAKLKDSGQADSNASSPHSSTHSPTATDANPSPTLNLVTPTPIPTSPDPTSRDSARNRSASSGTKSAFNPLRQSVEVLMSPKTGPSRAPITRTESNSPNSNSPKEGADDRNRRSRKKSESTCPQLETAKKEGVLRQSAPTLTRKASQRAAPPSKVNHIIQAQANTWLPDSLPADQLTVYFPIDPPAYQKVTATLVPAQTVQEALQALCDPRGEQAARYEAYDRHGGLVDFAQSVLTVEAGVLFLLDIKECDSVLERLCSCAWEGKLAEVLKLMQMPALCNIINKHNARGQTALYCAARNGHNTIVLAFVNFAGIDMNVKAKDHEGTALHAAGYNEHTVTSAILLTAGAQYDIVNKAKLTARQEARGAVLDVYSLFESNPTALLTQFPMTQLVQIHKPTDKKKIKTSRAGLSDGKSSHRKSDVMRSRHKSSSEQDGEESKDKEKRKSSRRSVGFVTGTSSEKDKDKKERRASIRDAFSAGDKDKEEKPKESKSTRRSVTLSASTSNATPERSDKSDESTGERKEEPAQPEATGGARRMLKRSLSVSNKGRKVVTNADGAASNAKTSPTPTTEKTISGSKDSNEKKSLFARFKQKIQLQFEIAPEVQEAMVDQGLGEEELVDMANHGILSNVTKWAENQNQRAVEDFERRQKSRGFLNANHRNSTTNTNEPQEPAPTRSLAQQGTAASGLRIDVPKAAENSDMSLYRELVQTTDPKPLYEGLTKIGQGATGAIYKSLQIDTKLDVAIKEMKFSRSSLPLLLNEIVILRECKCDFIIEFIAAYKKGQHLWMILELMDGGNLQSVIELIEKNPFAEQHVARVIYNITSAVNHMHNLKYMHRDIKSDNILINKRGQVKLADFGYSVKMVDNEMQTAVVGTPYWMAPEVIAGTGYTYSADVWSIGIILHEIIEGDPPYMEFPPIKAMYMITKNEAPIIQKKISSDLQSFFTRTMVKDPVGRPTTEEMLKHQFCNLACSEDEMILFFDTFQALKLKCEEETTT